VDHAGQGDVAQVLAQVLLCEQRDLRAIGAHVDFLGGRGQRIHGIRHGVVVFARGRHHQIHGQVAHAWPQASDHAEIDQGVLGLLLRAQHEHVSWMRISMEEAILEDLLHDDMHRQSRQISPGEATLDRVVNL
jgi:hypothetical protein